VETVAVLENGNREVRFIGMTAEEAITSFGRLPLPPYVSRDPDESDEDRYQTVYADREGSVAAPTAGSHFTPQLLAALRANGVRFGHARPGSRTGHIQAGGIGTAQRTLSCIRSVSRSRPTWPRAVSETRAAGSHVVGGRDHGRASARIRGGARRAGPSDETRRPVSSSRQATSSASSIASSQLPPAPLNAPDAGERLRGRGDHSRRIPARRRCGR
jgi:S-adenosylmethionine:tRNA ribosyltransferase-isomerase